ncbi:hypothetical protein PANT_6d00055 [Moesziomyces antarcticus T-34]|uniref:Uncharacterized protein n=1 Tax=Pseudozyma antarctica (strain T-34) TaxID=1151754 RepID=M9MCW5_PSEA3|nr:hypothetical protein PANT_6d00055 [Moesziomyces antarcticus T-34]
MASKPQPSQCSVLQTVGRSTASAARVIRGIHLGHPTLATSDCKAHSSIDIQHHAAHLIDPNDTTIDTNTPNTASSVFTMSTAAQANGMAGGAAVASDSPTKQAPVLVSTVSSEDVSSPDEVVSDSSKSNAIHSDSSSQPKLKGILENANDVVPTRRASRSGSESGFRAALKATFLPPPTPGRQIKLKDGKRLGKTFKRTEPRPSDFEGGQVLEYDPRGKQASAGDGILPAGCLKPPPLDRRDSASESGYGSDHESSLGTPSEVGEFSDLSRSYTSEASSTWASTTTDSNERGRPQLSHPSRARQSSMASTTSSSSNAAIKFAPLPVSGRLKRANSITIGVAARSHLLQSQGTAAPPRQSYVPPHVHSSQSWYTHNAHPRQDDVVDVGEEIKKGATKVMKLLRGGGGGGGGSGGAAANEAAGAKPQGTVSNAAGGAPSEAQKMQEAKQALLSKPKKVFPKEGAPVADPQTGELTMANGDSVHADAKISTGDVANQAKKLPGSELAERANGEETPRRAASPTAQLRHMSISEEPEEEDAAAALEAAHASNAAKAQHRPNGHHPHDLQDGPQHNSFHLADDHDAALDSGAATPRSGMQRRLSTGAFLRGLSIRGIQEDRRRDLLGLEEGEKRDSTDKNDADRHGFAVRGPSGKEEELGLEGYGHSRPVYS